MRNSPDSSCVEYLLTHPSLDCGISFHDTERVNIFIYFVVNHIADWPLSVLEKMIQHPTSPDIESSDRNGNTALHCLCQGQDYGHESNSVAWRERKVFDSSNNEGWWNGENPIDHFQLLLKYGADRPKKNEHGERPEDILLFLLRVARSSPEENLWAGMEDFYTNDISDIEEVFTMIRRPREGQRDASQKTITNFFSIKQKQAKRRRRKK